MRQRLQDDMGNIIINYLNFKLQPTGIRGKKRQLCILVLCQSAQFHQSPTLLPTHFRVESDDDDDFNVESMAQSRDGRTY